jgi:hypothetical protein
VVVLVEGIGTFAVEIQELGVFKLAQTMLHKTKEKALQSQLPEGWKLETDLETGDYYYYNLITGGVTLEQPTEPAFDPALQAAQAAEEMQASMAFQFDEIVFEAFVLYDPSGELEDEVELVASSLYLGVRRKGDSTNTEEWPWRQVDSPRTEQKVNELFD